jgi:hypothetical protein
VGGQVLQQLRCSVRSHFNRRCGVVRQRALSQIGETPSQINAIGYFAEKQHNKGSKNSRNTTLHLHIMPQSPTKKAV